MSRYFAFSLVALSLTAACSDPKCPRDLIQRGKFCRRCPEGSEAQHNECVALDGGQVVDPIEEDDAAVESDDDLAIQTDDAGNASAGEGAADRGATVDGSFGQQAGSSDGQTSAADTAAPDANTGVDAGPSCYADKDRDGVGAGQSVSCEGYGDGGTGLSLLNTDCDDNDDKRSPSLTDVCGDNVDNDCDGTPDDESNNACGGPCTAQLAHQPGEACDNGLLGACARTASISAGATARLSATRPRSRPRARSAATTSTMTAMARSTNQTP